jgi:Sigma-70, region 4
MQITTLGLSQAATTRLLSVGITTVEQLTSRTARELLDASINPSSLYETVCVLADHQLALPLIPGGGLRSIPDRRARELLRLRFIERLTLDEIGQRHNISRERVRQLLALYFGLRGLRPK